MAGKDTREYNITECSSDIDETLLEGEIPDLDGDILVGTVSCSGTVLNYEK